jgi:hypothetical protein
MKKLTSFLLGGVSLMSLAAITSCGSTEETQQDFYVVVDTKDAKTTYLLGSDINYDNVKLYKKTSDSDKKTEVTGFSIKSETYDKDRVGDYQVAIVYTENDRNYYAYYNVNVYSILDSQTHIIGLECEGGKREYNLNEDFSSAGLKVTAIYSDGQSKDVTDKAVIDSSRFDKTYRGQYEISVSYQEDYVNGNDRMTQVEDTFYYVKLNVPISGIKFRGGQTKFEQYSTGDDGTQKSITTSDWTIKGVFAGKEIELEKDEYTYNIKGFTNTHKTGNYEVEIISTENSSVKATKTITITPFIEPDYYFNASDLSTGDITEHKVINDAITITATEKNKVSVDDKKQMGKDQFAFQNRLKLSGAGTNDSRSIKLTLTKGAKIIVYAMSSNDERYLSLLNAEGDELDTKYTNTSDLFKLEYNVDSEGTYYLYGIEAINIYYVGVWLNK